MSLRCWSLTALTCVLSGCLIVTPELAERLSASYATPPDGWNWDGEAPSSAMDSDSATAANPTPPVSPHADTTPISPGAVSSANAKGRVHNGVAESALHRAPDPHGELVSSIEPAKLHPKSALAIVPTSNPVDSTRDPLPTLQPPHDAIDDAIDDVIDDATHDANHDAAVDPDDDSDADSSDPKKDSDDNDSLEDLNHERNRVAMQLEIAEVEREGLHAEHDHQQNILEQELIQKRHAFEYFSEHERVRTREQAELDLAETTARHVDAEAELQQLEMMYKGSELEDRTSEIVLERGRRQLRLASQRLDLDRRKLKTLLEHELPQKQRELQQGVAKAEFALESHQRKRRVAVLGQELKVIELRYKLERTSRKINAKSSKTAHDTRSSGDAADLRF